MRNDYFLKVLHEEPLDQVSLEAIKGGTCECNNGACYEKCSGVCPNDCKCNGTGSCNKDYNITCPQQCSGNCPGNQKIQL